MNNQVAGRRRQHFLTILLIHGVGLAYFLGSQKELGLALLRGEKVEGKPDSDLDLGVVLLEHPLLLEEENAHVQYAAIRGILIYAVNKEFARQYRGQAKIPGPFFYPWVYRLLFT